MNGQEQISCWKVVYRLICDGSFYGASYLLLRKKKYPHSWMHCCCLEFLRIKVRFRWIFKTLKCRHSPDIFIGISWNEPVSLIRSKHLKHRHKTFENIQQIDRKLREGKKRGKVGHAKLDKLAIHLEIKWKMIVTTWHPTSNNLLGHMNAFSTQLHNMHDKEINIKHIGNNFLR